MSDIPASETPTTPVATLDVHYQVSVARPSDSESPLTDEQRTQLLNALQAAEDAIPKLLNRFCEEKVTALLPEGMSATAYVAPPMLALCVYGGVLELMLKATDENAEPQASKLFVLLDVANCDEENHAEVVPFAITPGALKPIPVEELPAQLRLQLAERPGVSAETHVLVGCTHPHRPRELALVFIPRTAWEAEVLPGFPEAGEEGAPNVG
jgi:hypothetical protein